MLCLAVGPGQSRSVPHVPIKGHSKVEGARGAHARGKRAHYRALIGEPYSDRGQCCTCMHFFSTYTHKKKQLEPFTSIATTLHCAGKEHPRLMRTQLGWQVSVRLAPETILEPLLLKHEAKHKINVAAQPSSICATITGILEKKAWNGEWSHATEVITLGWNNKSLFAVIMQFADML